MTVPDENAPKTKKTDPLVTQPADDSGKPGERGSQPSAQEQTAVGEELREAMEQADAKREDFEEQ